MFLMEPVKFYLVVIIFYAAAFSANAEEVFTDAVPLEVDKAFVIDHMVTGPNEVIVRWQISENYYLYKEKFIIADKIFSDIALYRSPEAGFFLWLEVDDDENATKSLWREAGVRVLPGSYLSRDTEYGNPGKKFIRVALVEPIEAVEQGLIKIKNVLYN